MTTVLAYTQVFDRVGDSLLASTACAVLPLLTLFVLRHAGGHQRRDAHGARL
jgi:hypothetical protein